VLGPEERTLLAAARAESTCLARKRQESLCRAAGAAQAQEAEVRVAAADESLEEVDDSGMEGAVDPAEPMVVDALQLIEVVIDDAHVQETAEAIIGAARTGKIGDGKVFIYPVEQAIRIRNNDTGDAAL